MSKSIADCTELIITYYPKLRKAFRQLVSIKDVPISMTQLVCLFILKKHKELSMSDLADELNMSSQQLTKVVDTLVNFGMAERTVNQVNRRKIYTKLTDKGEELICSLQAELENKLERVAGKISPDETDKLYASLAHLASYWGYKKINPPM